MNIGDISFYKIFNIYDILIYIIGFGSFVYLYFILQNNVIYHQKEMQQQGYLLKTTLQEIHDNINLLTLEKQTIMDTIHIQEALLHNLINENHAMIIKITDKLKQDLHNSLQEIEIDFNDLDFFNELLAKMKNDE